MCNHCNGTWISKSTVFIKMHVHLNMLKETSIWNHWITKYVLLFFPNFKQNAAIFPNSKGPWPQSVPKTGVRALSCFVFLETYLRVNGSNTARYRAECREPVQQTREGPTHARLRGGGECLLPSVSIGQCRSSWSHTWWKLRFNTH